MAANPIIVPITPPRVAFLDERGFISREWYRFLLSLATQVESGAIDVDILLLAPEAVTADQIAVLEAQIQALALQPLPQPTVPDPDGMKYVPVSGGDDTATIQALINAGLNTLYFHAATYSYTTLTIDTPVRFCGVVSSIDGEPATVLNRTGADAATGITFGAIASPQLSGILVENIVFTADAATGGVLMQFNHCADVIVRGCQFHTLNLTAKAIGFEQVNTFTVTDTRIINPTAAGIYGESDDTHRSDVINLTRVIISGDSTGAHIYIPNAVELNGFVNTLCITDCEFVNPGRGVYRHNTIGATPRPEFISSTNLQVDYPYYEGIRLAAGSSAFFADTYIHGSVTTHNVYVGYNAVNTIDNISFIGGQCTGAYLAGMYLNGNYQKIIGMEISGNSLQTSGTYPGVEIGPNSQSTVITGNHIGERAGYQAATQNYAVKINSGALQIVIANNDLKNNVTGTILNGGDGTNSEYILGPNLGITTPDSFATQVVTTGFNVVFGPAALQFNVSHMSFFPAGTLATGTLTLFTKPADFQTLTVFSTQTITALTLTPGAGQFISATCPSTISARGFISIFYNPSDSTWYPCAESSGTPTGPTTYPGAGIANSTGTAWGTSYTTTGTGTVVALATNPRFAGNVEITDASYFLNIQSSDPYLNFDSNDYLSYTRSTNKMNFTIGGSAIATVTATGVGIGTSSPSSTLSIIGTTNPAVELEYYETGTGGASYRGRKARGTVASPTAVASNDYISTLLASGYGATGFGGNIGLIGFRANQNFTDTARGTNIVFENTPDASTTRTERMRITSAGNVGIGTASPTTTLDVNGLITSGNIAVRGDGSEGGQVLLNNAANSAGAYIFDVDNLGHGRIFTVANNTNLSLGQLAGTGGVTLFYTAATERMRITAAGDVGIGTSSPLTQLNVSYSILVTGDGGYYGGQAYYASGAWRNAVTGQGGYAIRNTTGVFTVFTGASANAAGTPFADFAERMRIDSAGNVGIGTATPGVALDVSSTTNTGAQTIRAVNTNAGASVSSRILATNGANEGGLIYRGTGHADAGQLLIYNNSSTAPITTFLNGAERMRITSAGNVGIGTTTPAFPLEVVGTARISSKLEVADANYFLNIQSSDPYLNFDSNDYISYTRSSNTFNIVIGGVLMASVTSNGIAFKSYIVSALPAGADGVRAFVTDALAPVFGSAVSGGGTVHVPVYYSGTAWMVG